MKIGLTDEIPEVPENLSASLKDMIKLCLKRDPDERPTASQLMEHEFLKTSEED